MITKKEHAELSGSLKLQIGKSERNDTRAINRYKDINTRKHTHRERV